MSGWPGTAAVLDRRRTLEAVAAHVRCPVCAGPVVVGDDQVTCGRGHGFNIARQGYVSLTSGRGGPGLVLDLAGGTGYYLARVLDALDGRLGACVDLSAPALRRAARAHPRAAALGADAWAHLPLADGSAALVLSVFGPRNPDEIRRVLAPGGTLIVATPGPEHLAELRRPLGLIGIDERKSARLAQAYGGYASTAARPVRYELRLGRDELTDLVAMGPSARHIAADDLAARVAALPAPVTVTVDVEVRSYQG